MANSRDIWKLLAFSLPVPVLFLLLGDTKWALISLCLIPIPFICWGLSLLFAGHRLREIAAHMTVPEHKHYKKLAETYGRKAGFLAVGFFATYFILSYILGVKNYIYYILAFTLFILVGLPYALRHRKEMIRYAYSTKYAKEKGWNNEYK